MVNSWLGDAEVKVVIGENPYLAVSNLLTRSLWNTDAVAMLVKILIRRAVWENDQPVSLVFAKQIHGIRHHNEFPCSRGEQDIKNADVACGILFSPAFTIRCLCLQ